MHIAPTTFQTECDAQRWLAGERLLSSPQEWVSPSGRAEHAAAAEVQRRARTLSAYAEAWLASRLTQSGAALRPAANFGSRNALDNHILPAFGDLPLDEITTAAVRTWRRRVTAKGT